LNKIQYHNILPHFSECHIISFQNEEFDTSNTLFYPKKSLLVCEDLLVQQQDRLDWYCIVVVRLSFSFVSLSTVC